MTHDELLKILMDNMKVLIAAPSIGTVMLAIADVKIHDEQEVKKGVANVIEVLKSVETSCHNAAMDLQLALDARNMTVDGED